MFELFYEKFVLGEVSGIQKLARSDTRDPSLKVASETLVTLEKICLHNGRNSGRFVAHLLEKGLKLKFFQR